MEYAAQESSERFTSTCTIDSDNLNSDRQPGDAASRNSHVIRETHGTRDLDISTTVYSFATGQSFSHPLTLLLPIIHLQLLRMKTELSMLALTGAATAQYMLPGGAIPMSVQAPSTSGFMNATIHPSRGGAAICVSGMILSLIHI